MSEWNERRHACNLTLTGKQLKCRYDTQETVLDISLIPYYQLLQNLHEIFEKVNVHKMRKFG